ncbi:LOG family protein [Solitalea koreensis]|uniref:Cytokinin riboside 5'-monophosphate phosphoribohydrolase n=1 Tax=Solitalea koreensis TaxID=543615 RepID=A0A521C154_9SPHI|nr:TIGR00730 family Rossman fold protein [Solitalea koreensis]SMO52440.1 hypothetical protein SAMN06265350_10365 [Solitalea koreensis]
MKSICVFCGSKPGAKPIYKEKAIELAKLLVEQDITLVYGGGAIGLMGELARTVRDLGGKVIGIIPDFLMSKEVGLVDGCELHVVKNMHQRKAKMAELSDGFIALPGGIGTFEELFEVLTWKQLSLHKKPIGLLNINSYYDHLLTFMKHAEEEQFFNESGLMKVADEPLTLLQLMSSEHSETTAHYNLI